MKNILVALVFSGFAIAAPAQQGGGREACRPDVQQYCSSAAGGGAEQIKDCLIEHQKDISDACYDFLKSNLSQKQSGPPQGTSPGGGACKADVPQFCKGVQPGGGRIKDCLIDHQKEISDACYDFLSKQKSGEAGSGDNAAASQTTAPSAQIYRSRQANGSTVYSDTLQPNAVTVKRVQIDNGNSALPFR